MRRLAILACLLSSACWAQSSADFQPATTNVWGAEYPRVDGKGRVQVRIKAPEAVKVRLNVWSGPKLDMAKQPDGYCLSMGGMQTFRITFNHLDLFSYIGGFSGAGSFVLGDRKLDPRTDYGGALADPQAFEKRVRLLWLGVGTAEPPIILNGLRRLHASLDEARIKHVYYESPGTAHEWQTWRRDLKDFVPRLF